MAKDPRRIKLPDGVTHEQVMKSCLILVSCSEIALEQLYIIEGTGSSFYRQELKAALKKAKAVIEPYVEEYLNWADDPDEVAEKTYYQFTQMIELFNEVIAGSSGEKLNILNNVLTSFKSGEFKTVSEEEFENISEKES